MDIRSKLLKVIGETQVQPKNEEFNVEDAIKSLIEINFSASEEEKGKASQLMKGLFFSKDEKAIKFIEKLDKMLSSMKMSEECEDDSEDEVDEKVVKQSKSAMYKSMLHDAEMKKSNAEKAYRSMNKVTATTASLEKAKEAIKYWKGRVKSIKDSLARVESEGK